MPAERVLVVEDHPESAEGLAVLLEIWGYEPHIAYDGAQAIELTRTLAPAVIVTDLGLADIDGVDLARKILGHEANGTVFLIAVTGRGEDEAGGLDVFDCVLRKPLDVAALERVLQDRPGAKSDVQRHAMDSGPAGPADEETNSRRPAGS